MPNGLCPTDDGDSPCFCIKRREAYPQFLGTRQCSAVLAPPAPNLGRPNCSPHFFASGMPDEGLVASFEASILLQSVCELPVPTRPCYGPARHFEIRVRARPNQCWYNCTLRAGWLQYWCGVQQYLVLAVDRNELLGSTRI